MSETPKAKPSEQVVYRVLEPGILKSDSPEMPIFIGGNLCDPLQVSTIEERQAQARSLNTLANDRSRDAANMTNVAVGLRFKT